MRNVHILSRVNKIFCRRYSPPPAVGVGVSTYRIAMPRRVVSTKVITPKKLLTSVSTDTLTTSSTYLYFVFASLSKSAYSTPPKGIPKKYAVVPLQETEPKILYFSPEGKDLSNIEGYEIQAIKNKLIRIRENSLTFTINSFGYKKSIHLFFHVYRRRHDKIWIRLFQIKTHTVFPVTGVNLMIAPIFAAHIKLTSCGSIIPHTCIIWQAKCNFLSVYPVCMTIRKNIYFTVGDNHLFYIASIIGSRKFNKFFTVIIPATAFFTINFIIPCDIYSSIFADGCGLDIKIINFFLFTSNPIRTSFVSFFGSDFIFPAGVVACSIQPITGISLIPYVINSNEMAVASIIGRGSIPKITGYQHFAFQNHDGILHEYPLILTAKNNTMPVFPVADALVEASTQNSRNVDIAGGGASSIVAGRLQYRHRNNYRKKTLFHNRQYTTEVQIC